ncbi:unnamed protein product [Acanthoscelides obtectus]|uniref:Uncharacterized protein n=1 Tax=Acanthoscelides obtectus TaxID=200917 RepID=A0A9P0KBX2_ACAOB|nr:unnamed protein product [Acanthoscelides obtectus]CAK1668760.1 hypothetical protein AOBTE_LOCUS26589 [Acanthoscelides obtectus]
MFAYYHQIHQSIVIYGEIAKKYSKQRQVVRKSQICLNAQKVLTTAHIF